MSKHIQAYFKTESEAEGARMSLMTFTTEQLEVGELQGGVGFGGDRGGRVVVPLLPLTGANNTTYTGGTAAAGGAGSMIGDQAVPVPSPAASRDVGGRPVDKDDVEDVNENASDADLRDLTYTLSAKVKEEDYADVVRKLRNNNGFVHVYD